MPDRRNQPRPLAGGDMWISQFYNNPRCCPSW
jgi:hypothetical protein